MADESYGPMMGINAFFNAPDLPASEIGGWYVRGHDANDHYQEFVVPIAGDSAAQDVIFPKVDGWLDWHRVPLAKGSPLLQPSE